MTKLISVITPFYNSDKLTEAVMSIVLQDYKRIELIIIDDCSAPELSARLRREAEEIAAGKLESFVWVTHEQNLGTVKTVNEAWLMSKGEYVFTLAHDDVFWNEHVLSSWVSAFEQTEADIIAGFRAVHDPDLNTLRYLSPSPIEEKLLRNNDTDRIRSRLYRSNFIFGCSVARTRASIDKYGLIPEDYRLIEDYPMNLRCYRMGAKVCLIDRIVVKYRSGGTSLPQNVSDTYQTDTKHIYENEILPYIRPQWYGRHLMKRQLSERERKGAYSVMRSRKVGIIWNLYCHLCYPEFFISYIRMLSEKRARKKQLQRILESSGKPFDSLT